MRLGAVLALTLLFGPPARANVRVCETSLYDRTAVRVTKTMGHRMLTAAEMGEDARRYDACMSFEPPGIYVASNHGDADRRFMLHHESVHGRAWYDVVDNYCPATAAQCCFLSIEGEYRLTAPIPRVYHAQLMNNEILAYWRSHKLRKRMEIQGVPNDIEFSAAEYAELARVLAAHSDRAWDFAERELWRLIVLDRTFEIDVDPYVLANTIALVRLRLPWKKGRLDLVFPIPVAEVGDIPAVRSRMYQITRAWQHWLKTRRWRAAPAVDTPVAFAPRE